MHLVALLRPDMKVVDGDINTRDFGRAEHPYRGPLHTIFACAFPAVNLDVGVLYAGAGHGFHAAPSSVKVHGVGVAVASKVGQQHVADTAAAAVGLDHVHVVGVVRVYVSVLDVLDGCIRAYKYLCT